VKQPPYPTKKWYLSRFKMELLLKTYELQKQKDKQTKTEFLKKREKIYISNMIIVEHIASEVSGWLLRCHFRPVKQHQTDCYPDSLVIFP